MQQLKLTSRSVTKETKIVQISDAHIIVPDKKDGDVYKIEKERKLFFERESMIRTGEVRYAEEELAEAISYSNSADLTVFTGDIVATCPTILWILTTSLQFRLHEFHILRSTFPDCSTTSTQLM